MGATNMKSSFYLKGSICIVTLAYSIVLIAGGLLHISKIQSVPVGDYIVREEGSECNGTSLFPTNFNSDERPLRGCGLSPRKRFKGYRQTDPRERISADDFYLDQILMDRVMEEGTPMIVCSEATIHGFVESWLLLPLRMIKYIFATPNMDRVDKHQAAKVSNSASSDKPDDDCPRFMIPPMEDIIIPLIASKCNNMAFCSLYEYVSHHSFFADTKMMDLIHRYNFTSIPTDVSSQMIQLDIVDEYLNQDFKYMMSNIDIGCLTHYMSRQWNDMETGLWTKSEIPMTVASSDMVTSAFINNVVDVCSGKENELSTYYHTELHGTSFYTNAKADPRFFARFLKFGGLFSPWYLNAGPCLAIGSSMYTYMVIFILWLCTASFSETPIVVTHMPRLVMYMGIVLYRYIVLYWGLDALENSYVLNSFDFSDHLVMLMMVTYIYILEYEALRAGLANQMKSVRRIESNFELPAFYKTLMDYVTNEDILIPKVSNTEYLALLSIKVYESRGGWWIKYSGEKWLAANAVKLINKVLAYPFIGLCNSVSSIRGYSGDSKGSTLAVSCLYWLYICLHSINLYMIFYTAVFFHTRAEVAVGFVIGLLLMYLPVYLLATKESLALRLGYITEADKTM